MPRWPVDMGKREDREQWMREQQAEKRIPFGHGSRPRLPSKLDKVRHSYKKRQAGPSTPKPKV